MSTVKLSPFSAPAPCIERFTFRVISRCYTCAWIISFGLYLLLTYWTVFWTFFTSTTPAAGKIRRCSCGRRVSSLIHDFHSICIVCRGVDCDTDHRCPKCKDNGDLVMTKYVTHKISLQHKLQSKLSKREPVPAPVVAADAADVATDVVVSEPPSSPVQPSIPSVSPVPIDDSSQMSGVRGKILSQVKSLFNSFTQSWRLGLLQLTIGLARLCQIQPPKLINVVTVSDNISQDVLTVSFSAPSIVARCSEPTPGRVPFARYTGSMGTTLGGPGAIDVPTGDSPQSYLSFEDLLVIVRVLESSGGPFQTVFWICWAVQSSTRTTIRSLWVVIRLPTPCTYLRSHEPHHWLVQGWG